MTQTKTQAKKIGADNLPLFFFNQLQLYKNWNLFLVTH